MANGSRHSMYSVEESIYGETPSNPALDLVRITGTTLGLAKDSLQSEELRSDRQIADFRLGNNNVAGDINFELSYGSFDQFLQAALLSADWAADTPVAGTQQLKVGTERKSFSFVRHFADIATANKPYFIYRGCEINTLSLTVAANSMITGTFSIVGKSQELAQNLTGLGTPTYNPASTTAPFDSFTGTLTEGGSAIAVVTEVTLSLTNTIEPRFVVGSKETENPSVGRSNLTGSITAYFEDATLLDKFINESYSSLEFTLPDGAGNQQKYRIPRIVYTGGQPDVAGEGPITLSMPFQAILDPTETTNFIIERTPA